MPARLAPPLLAALLLACGGDRPAGEIEGASLPEPMVESRTEARRSALRELAGPEADGDTDKRILFGDLHVHTTYSLDAFVFALPVFGGAGSHPPADACDFARYCAGLDFFALTDHARELTPEHWRAEIDSVRQCNAKAGDPQDPDLVAYLGFEWTQQGGTPEAHYGHRNVIFPELGDDALPARPITSLSAMDRGVVASSARLAPMLRVFDPLEWSVYADLAWMLGRLRDQPRCPEDVSTRELPPHCREDAPTPEILHRKLDEWGLDALVIPHGTTWGLYTPPTDSLDDQLTRAYHDPERERLIEVMSGHGNSEEHRPWRAFEKGADGEPVCQPPGDDYLPCCWRAGELVRERCGDLPEAECDARVEEARRLAMEAGVGFRFVVPDASVEEWLDCGQCRDCFKPTYGQRPGESVQYGLSLSNFDEPTADGRPLRFRFGLVASSDNHSARPGTGYKQVDRPIATDVVGPRSALVARAMQFGMPEGEAPRPVPDAAKGRANFERYQSFLYPGGLAAVHATGRDRRSIWEALVRREAYGTSGPRILLWFDLVNAPEGPHPMGSAVTLAKTPRFRVRAVGAFEQQDGCPETSRRGLRPERLHALCRDECHHPGDRRHPITAIEVIRIRPRLHPEEPAATLIEDPWRRFACEPDPRGCVVEFEDPEFVESERDTVYYVRALQEETLAINGDGLRTTFDDAGNPVSVEPCWADYRTPPDDDCLAPVQERAWSSPIFLDQKQPPVRRRRIRRAEEPGGAAPASG